MKRPFVGLMLCLCLVPSWTQSLPSTLTEVPQLNVTASDVARTPWLIVGPLSRAWKVTLEIQGTGLRRSIELPIIAGQPVTWSIPLDRVVRTVKMVGAWDQGSPSLRLARSPSASPQGLQITLLQGTQGQLGYRIHFPEWHTAPGYTPLLNFTVRSLSGWLASISDGTSERRFEVSAGVPRWSYSPRAWGVEPREVTLWSSGKDPTFALQDLKPTGLPPGLPIVADAETLLRWPSQEWRTPSHEWYTWSVAPSVLVLVSATYREQDAWFKRLAFFVEKAGFRGQILSDDAMAKLHGWNAHDYQAADLAEFYSKALAMGTALTPQERELRDRLVAAGVILADGTAGWRAGEGAVLGISAESSPALRTLLFTHEAFHGLYFTDLPFRQVTRDLWNQLSEAARTAVREFLAPGQYDTSFEALVINEFQAYLLQQSAQETPAYLASRMIAKAQLSPADKAQALAELTLAAQVLDQSVERMFGVRSGEVRSVRPWAEKTTK